LSKAEESTFMLGPLLPGADFPRPVYDKTPLTPVMSLRPGSSSSSSNSSSIDIDMVQDDDNGQSTCNKEVLSMLDNLKEEEETKENTIWKGLDKFRNN
jgi:hypothetical protein